MSVYTGFSCRIMSVSAGGYFQNVTFSTCVRVDIFVSAVTYCRSITFPKGASCRIMPVSTGVLCRIMSVSTGV